MIDRADCDPAHRTPELRNYVNYTCLISFSMHKLARSSHSVLCGSRVEHDVWKGPDKARCSIYVSRETFSESLIRSMKDT